MRLAFLGPAGTFGEEAALRVTGATALLPYPSHAAVAAAVDAGEADVGVLAIENSLSGSVAETLDILIHDTNLRIQGELVVPVVHNLVVVPGATLEGIRYIYSHPQAFGQCRKFLAARLPEAGFQASLSTSSAVTDALARGPSGAAIATVRAAEVHGGEVLCAGIQDSGNNVTRFVIVGRESPPPSGRDRTSIAFTFAEETRPGAVASVLVELAKREINCTKIESRPTREVFATYVFLVDFEGHVAEPPASEAIAAIRPLCSSLKVFGSYPRWN